MFEEFQGKTVLVTGHTGFKGAWLCEWLLMKGADVIGYSLEAPSQPALCDLLNLSERMTASYHKDIRDLDELITVIKKHQPDYIFHMAAQTLVSEGYRDPIYNYGSNVMGTVNILEAMRRTELDCICIVVTTDKVYENREWLFSYRENDEFGGFDPYSASKGCAEIVSSSYVRSYFLNKFDGTGPIAATVRAGNVIGGGDWALNRIVPDCIKGLREGRAIPIRNRTSTRPWQHVLEPLSAYMMLALLLADLKVEKASQLADYCSGFNFGPNISSNKTVEDLVLEILKHWPGEWLDKSDPNAIHEAGKLNLASDKAFHLLNWRPRWNFETTVKHTVEWYKACDTDVNLADLQSAAITNTQRDISAYEQSCFLS